MKSAKSEAITALSLAVALGLPAAASAQNGGPLQLYSSNKQLVGSIDNVFGTVIREIAVAGYGNINYAIVDVSIQNGFAPVFVFDYATGNCSGQKYVPNANSQNLIWSAQVYNGEIYGPKPQSPGSHVAAVVNINFGSMEYMWGTTDYCQVVSPPEGAALTPVYPLQNVSTLIPPFFNQ